LRKESSTRFTVTIKYAGVTSKNKNTCTDLQILVELIGKSKVLPGQH